MSAHNYLSARWLLRRTVGDIWLSDQHHFGSLTPGLWHTLDYWQSEAHQTEVWKVLLIFHKGPHERTSSEVLGSTRLSKDSSLPSLSECPWVTISFSYRIQCCTTNHIVCQYLSICSTLYKYYELNWTLQNSSAKVLISMWMYLEPGPLKRSHR